MPRKNTNKSRDQNRYFDVSQEVDQQILRGQLPSKIIQTIQKEWKQSHRSTLTDSRARDLLGEIVLQGFNSTKNSVQSGGGRVLLPRQFFDPEYRGGRRTRSKTQKNNKKNNKKNNTRKNLHKKQHNRQNSRKQRRQMGGTFGSVSDNTVPGSVGAGGPESVATKAAPAHPHAADMGASHLGFADSPSTVVQDTLDLATGKTPVFTPSRSDVSNPELQLHSSSSGGVVETGNSSDEGIEELKKTVNMGEGGDTNFTLEPPNLSEYEKADVARNTVNDFIRPHGVRYDKMHGGATKKYKTSNNLQKKQQKKQTQQKQQTQKQGTQSNHIGGSGGASSDWKSTLYSKGPINTPELEDNTSPFSETQAHQTKEQLLESLGINSIKNENVGEILPENNRSGLSVNRFGGGGRRRSRKQA